MVTLGWREPARTGLAGWLAGWMAAAAAVGRPNRRRR